MTHDCPRAAGKDGGHLSRARRGGCVTNEIDAAVNPVQPARLDPMGDRALADPSQPQLHSRDHPVLSRREAGDRLVRPKSRASWKFWIDVIYNPRLAGYARAYRVPSW
jgi:hypothetical protein